MTDQKNYKERRVYRFECAGPCGNKRAVSYRRSRAKLALCKKCRAAKVDERQQTIFPQVPAPETPQEATVC